MTQENKGKDILKALAELDEAQETNARSLKRGRRFVEELKKASEDLRIALDILDPDKVDAHAGMNEVQVADYPSRQDVRELLADYRGSTKTARHNESFLRSCYPRLKL